MNNTGSVIGISGPVVRAAVDFPVRMFEIVHAGRESLLGEVIRIRGKEVDIQVYEETAGMRVGEPVVFSGELLSVELGPGLLGSVLDGIGRPLARLRESGLYIGRGANIGTLDENKAWEFSPALRAGDPAQAGETIGTLPEGARILHKLKLPPNALRGRVEWIAPAGRVTLREPVCRLEDGTEITLSHRWEVRKGRPFASRLPFNRPLLTGQRILDTLFPMALGGAAVIPGGFGTGKTVTQQSLAKWCNADVIVYIGCGERGNEMTEVLEEFPTLMDPYHNIPLMERMVLVANTSNMPVAAREASIYVGATLAEFYRDMGYNVAMMADSTSRWGEALREVSGRLEEMPGEEGYPAYLATRLAAFYERSGRVKPLGADDDERVGSVTMVGAVSPAGGDMSEPMTQNSLRVTGAFWALDTSLAHRRHFPAISWTKSYTLFLGQVKRWYEANVAEDWLELRDRAMSVLQKETELQEIVQLVGPDALPESEKVILEVARMLREDFLQQFAFDEVDAYCPPKKQYWLLKTILAFHEAATTALNRGVSLRQVMDLPIRDEIATLKTTPHEEALERMSVLVPQIAEDIAGIEVY